MNECFWDATSLLDLLTILILSVKNRDDRGCYNYFNMLLNTTLLSRLCK